MVTEGSQAQTNPLSWERLAHGTSCPADVPGRMQLRRAIAGGQASVFPGRWLPTSPLSPYCIPRWINVQENPAPGLLLQAKCQGKSAGGCRLALGAGSGMDLGTEIWATTSMLAARAGRWDHPGSQRSLPALHLPVPAGMLQANGGWGPHQSRVGLCIPAARERPATRCPQALLVGHRWHCRIW